MTGKYFLDTNFLIYCFSNSEPEKRAKCLKILQKGKEKAYFVISTQVIKEFSAVMIRKFKVSPLEVKSIIDNLAQFEVVTVDINIIKDGIDLFILHQLSFWDSIIIAAAKHAKCHILISEDLHHKQNITGVTIQNPFKMDI